MAWKQYGLTCSCALAAACGPIVAFESDSANSGSADSTDTLGTTTGRPLPTTSGPMPVTTDAPTTITTTDGPPPPLTTSTTTSGEEWLEVDLDYVSRYYDSWNGTVYAEFSVEIINGTASQIQSVILRSFSFGGAYPWTETGIEVHAADLYVPPHSLGWAWMVYEGRGQMCRTENQYIQVTATFEVDGQLYEDRTLAYSECYEDGGSFVDSGSTFIELDVGGDPQ
jgi:hypothetical protein